ncbi:MAG: hypothetical protein OXH79_08730 [Boseongicola sp.]|nr:hypothetical protein [Boseongicola sp.]
MSGSRILGLLLLAPAFVFVVLFFLAPVVLTAVFATLMVFNTGLALVLSIVTHYMPDRLEGTIRSIWLLPRISPPVLCVLPWKWLAWDTGFLSRILVPPGFESRNRMLEAGADRVASSVLQLDILGDMRCMNSHLTTSACTVIEEGKA